jgi:hypothetical protein
MGNSALGPFATVEPGFVLDRQVIIDGVPDRALEFALARRLGYRALFSPGLLTDLLVMLMWVSLGFVVTSVFLGVRSFSATIAGEMLWLGAQMAVLFAMLILGWRLFGIWSLAPGVETPLAIHERFSVVGDRLLAEFSDSRVYLDIDAATHFAEMDDHVIIRVKPDHAPMLFYADRFVADGRATLLALLERRAKRIGRWDSRSLLQAAA